MKEEAKDKSLRAVAEARAKVNLFLQVTGKRPDGYHDIRSLVCPVDLCDTLSVEVEPGGREVAVSLACRAPGVPEDERNLAWRAARLFFQQLGRPAAVRLALVKRIPAGAGLGGGSSDAGAILRILNNLFGNPFGLEALSAMAASLGADVPFFVREGPALIEGIGERVTPVEGILPRPVVIVHPGVSLSTAEVYAGHTLALTRPEKTHRFRILKEGPKGVATAADGPGLLEEALENDLEEPALRICPEVRDAKAEVARQGAAAVLMTGSGSAVFGLFGDDESARLAAEGIRFRRPAWFVHAGRLLTEHRGVVKR